MRQANGLLQLLEEAKWEITRWAKPLGVLLERLRKETEPLAYEAPERPDGDNLRKQLDIIEYYLGKGLIVQAVTLARELLVSWMCLQKGDRDWLDRKSREPVEEALNAAGKRQEGKPVEVPS